MLISTLAVKLQKSELASPAASLAWAWRIMNDYPDDLRECALAWASGNEQLPPASAGGFTLTQALELSRASVPSALEALYVASKDAEAGSDILFRCAPRDRKHE